MSLGFFATSTRRSRPPHFAHFRMSTANTRWSSQLHGCRDGSAAFFEAPFADDVGSSALSNSGSCAGGSAGFFGTTSGTSPRSGAHERSPSGDHVAFHKAHWSYDHGGISGYRQRSGGATSSSVTSTVSLGAPSPRTCGRRACLVGGHCWPPAGSPSCHCHRPRRRVRSRPARLAAVVGDDLPRPRVTTR